MAVAQSAVASNILVDILQWSLDLPGWQQDALRRLIANGLMAPQDLDELTSLCKSANGLSVADPLKLSTLMPEHAPRGTAVGQRVTLLSIAEPENVNALDAKQELKFAESGLTVVFGYNGSGKSGYGRILRRACRSRNNGPPILHNVMLDDAKGKPASAVITYAIDGAEQKPEQWVDDQRPIHALGSVSFFDVGCAVAHVQEKNSIAFTPYGLELLPKLGAACKEVQKRLDHERKRLDAARPKFLQSAQATGNTKVGRFLKSLNHETDPKPLVALASLSSEERLRLEELIKTLASDPKQQALEFRNRARRVLSLQARLSAAADLLSDQAIKDLMALAAALGRKREAAAAAAKLGFEGEPLADIGGEVWRELWESARRYSAVAYPDRPFPVVADKDALCLLCQQPLGKVAKDRLLRFEAFVSDDTALEAAKAEKVLDAAVSRLDALQLRGETMRGLLEDLGLVGADLLGKTRSMLAELLRRLRFVKTAAASGDWRPSFRSQLADLSSKLNLAAEGLNQRAGEVEKTSDQEERIRLEAELAELKAREWLASVLGDVKEHLCKLAELHKLGRCVEETRTTRITTKSKALAKELVTDKLRDAFASEIKRLQQGVRRLNVELVAAAGEFGSSYYRIQLVGAHASEIGDVVSEGEHQCIAMAGFLSELATEQSRSAIVFDDPVTSLDHHWRLCFARRLVEVASERQVIVFTHDIVFVHDLMGHAKALVVPLDLRRVQANRDSCGHVGDGLPWLAQKTLQRIDELEKQARATRKAYDAQDDDLYAKQVFEVYDGLRATIERAVEEWFFRGVVLRHRDYINLDELCKVTVISMDHCERLQGLFKKCCDVTPAHDRAPARGFGVPSPDDALGDIGQLLSIVKELRELQKTIA